MVSFQSESVVSYNLNNGSYSSADPSFRTTSHGICKRCNVSGCDLKVLDCGCFLHAVRFSIFFRTLCCRRKRQTAVFFVSTTTHGSLVLGTPSLVLPRACECSHPPSTCLYSVLLVASTAMYSRFGKLRPDDLSRLPESNTSPLFDAHEL